MSELLSCAVCPVKSLPELWRPLPISPSYSVSTHGRVRNAALRVLRPSPNKDGYMVMNLARPHRSQYVHRLVALTWLDPHPRDGQAWEVDHLDFDRAHNAVTNLRWLPKDTNAWRWKFWADETPPEWVEPEPESAEELAAFAARMRANGWPEPQPPKPWQSHRHLASVT